MLALRSQYRARRVAAGQTVIVDRSRNAAAAWRVGVRDLEAHRRRRRVAVAVRHRERRRRQRHRADVTGVRRERVRPVRLHLDQCRRRCRSPANSPSPPNTSAVPPMCVTDAPSAPCTKSSVPVTVAPSATFCDASAVAVGASSSKVTVSVPVAERAVRVGDRVGQARGRIGRVLVVRSGRMQHVVEQRHLVGAGCRVVT